MKLVESDFVMGIKFFVKKINVIDYIFMFLNCKYYLYKFLFFVLNCVCKIVFIV